MVIHKEVNKLELKKNTMNKEIGHKFTYLGDPFQWFSYKLGTVYSEEAKCPLAGDTNGKEFIVIGYLHVTNIVSRKILAIISIVYFSRICFVVDVKVEVLLVYCEDKGIIIFYCHQTLYSSHRQILTGLERVSFWFTVISVVTCRYFVW